jgi:hypothetical protein
LIDRAASSHNLLQRHARPAFLTAGFWHPWNVQEGLGIRWQVAVFLIALFAVFTRLPGALLHAQFFAEDGWVWYQQAYNLGWWRSLAITHGGYLQTLPRLVAGVSLLFPMQWAPLVMNVAGAVIQVLPVTALLSRRCAPWGPMPLRMLMAALYLAVPNAPEVHVVITNAMWHLALLQLLLALSYPPLKWQGRIVDILVFAVGSVSGPFCLLLLPCAAVYAWARRRRWTLVTIGIMLLGGTLQVLSFLHSVRNPDAAPLGANSLALLRIIAGNIFVDSMTGSGGPYLPVSMLLAAAAGGFAVLFCGWRSAHLPGRLAIVFATLVLLASLRDPLILVSLVPRWEVLANTTGIRYWFLPSLMFLWSAAWCAWGEKSMPVRYAAVAILLLTLIGVGRKWIYPPWPEGNFSADAQRFRSLNTGEHMLFTVFDPGGRKMELIKR